jgi:small Trp-rich protein
MNSFRLQWIEVGNMTPQTAFYVRRLTVGGAGERDKAMWFVIAGVLLLVMKVGEFGPVALWPWWWVLAPFGLAAVWWIWADSSGLTKKREIDKMQDRKEARRRKAMEGLGISREQSERTAAAERARAAAINRVEGKRDEKREQNRRTIRDSVLDSKEASEFGDKPGAGQPGA